MKNRKKAKTVLVKHLIQYDEPIDDLGSVSISAYLEFPKKDIRNTLRELIQELEIPNHPIEGREDYFYAIGVVDDGALLVEQSYFKYPDGTIEEGVCSHCIRSNGCDHNVN